MMVSQDHGAEQRSAAADLQTLPDAGEQHGAAGASAGAADPRAAGKLCDARQRKPQREIRSAPAGRAG